MSASFVHLCVHTEYSLVDGLVRVPRLMQAVADAGMPAVALTDQTNLFAMVKFYRQALATGLKPLIGVDMRLKAQGRDDQAPQRAVLLCRNQTGYGNLTRLVTRAYLEGQERGVPILDPEWLDREAAQGLIALSGGRDGAVGRALLEGAADEARRWADWWAERFDDAFYLQLLRTGRAGEEPYLHAAVELAATAGLPVVATNDVCFLAESDFAAHEARVCINNGTTLDDPRRPRLYSAEQYLRTAEEMAELFSDLPEALENTVHIATRCNLGLELGHSVLPDFPMPAEHTSESFLASEARRGLADRLGGEAEVDAQPAYAKRLATELSVINGMGFPGYFLIVADFIRWSRENAIPVGPGRGSGAGSLVAFALGITDIDPLEHDLLFERFLNPERVSQIITYGSMAARAVVRDTGRALGHPFGFVDRIAKLVPMELGITLAKALDQEQELASAYDNDEEVRGLLDLAMQLEGLARNAGKHAGGVVIAPSALTDFAPLYCEEGGDNVVTQFDKDDVEAVGLVKFDFLGLRTLTIIDWALATINEQRSERGEAPLRMAELGLADKQAYALLKRCETTAVFQLESRGMKDLVRRLQPDSFEDIVALVALFRPGPLQSGMVDDFIKRKHGEAPIDYPHPDLEPILRETYGVILYQEQVMQIAQVLAGYSLGGADLLRRAMGKKKPSEMAKQREIFQAGALERGVDPAVATHIFDLMEKFAGYGFNKSHSAAYAVLSFQTAWLKAHHPAAFMAAVLSA
ncbi:MAG: DNA polymerase III subunit alpha, partial [Pseudomonadota bacterium]